MVHIPVLQKEVIKYLDPKPNENFIDTTIGQGGHSLAILERTVPHGKVLGIDWTPKIIATLKNRYKFLKKRLILVCGNFANLERIVDQQKFKLVNGILFDLGVSSWHLEKSKKGFSFQRKEPLDMRYNPEIPVSAEKIVNSWPEPEIEKILKQAKERFAKKIAQQIVNSRKIKPIKDTFSLAKIINQATPAWYHRKRIHPATKTFLALRIAVNKELENLEKVLPQALKILNSRGRLVVISFHSLEDSIIKNFFKGQAKEGLLEILTKKPVTSSSEEIKINPRSRSAKLRAAIKCR